MQSEQIMSDRKRSRGGPRRGSGRKPAGAAATKRQYAVNTNLWPYQADYLRKVAKRNGVTLAEAFRIVIDHAVANAYGGIDVLINAETRKRYCSEPTSKENDVA